MMFPVRLLKPPFIYRGLHHSYRDCMGLSIATLDYRRVILISTYKMPISYHTMWLPEMETSHTVWHVLPEIASGYCTVCIVCFGKSHIYEWFLEKNDETWSHGDVLRLCEITIAGSWKKTQRRNAELQFHKMCPKGWWRWSTMTHGTHTQITNCR